MYSNKDGLYGIEIAIGSSFFRTLKNFRKSYICYNLKEFENTMIHPNDYNSQAIILLQIESTTIPYS